MNPRFGKVELTFFHSINQDVLEAILNKALTKTIRISDLGQVLLAYGKTDMRQGIDSLAYPVKSQSNLDSFSG